MQVAQLVRILTPNYKVGIFEELTTVLYSYCVAQITKHTEVVIYFSVCQLTKFEIKG
jgi:hypothetical protein